MYKVCQSARTMAVSADQSEPFLFLPLRMNHLCCAVSGWHAVRSKASIKRRRAASTNPSPALGMCLLPWLPSSHMCPTVTPSSPTYFRCVLHLYCHGAADEQRHPATSASKVFLTNAVCLSCTRNTLSSVTPMQRQVSGIALLKVVLVCS